MTAEKKDPRIKKVRNMRLAYGATYFVLLVLSAGQWMIYNEYVGFGSLPFAFIAGMLGYWAIVSGIFILLTHSQTRKKFDAPLKKLSAAAKQVAGGDFSIYVEPLHTPDKYDYIDVMFEDFNRMVEELGTIETLKNDFIANVSHEIKAPLSVIQSYASALKKETLAQSERVEYADAIVTATKNLAALVTNILKLNKLENQEISPLPAPYDLCRQLSECALNYEQAWEEKGIHFSAELEDRSMIEADASMLEIAWNNLLANAIKFTPAGGAITLHQTSDAESVTVTISDTGCGMDANTMKHIFDKFYQGDTSHSSEGNGLGLALSKRVVELAGGTIGVKSELGKGSVFTVNLKK